MECGGDLLVESVELREAMLLELVVSGNWVEASGTQAGKRNAGAPPFRFSGGWAAALGTQQKPYVSIPT